MSFKERVRGLGLATFLALGGSSVAKAEQPKPAPVDSGAEAGKPTKLGKKDLPILMPGEFFKIVPTERLPFAREMVLFIDAIFNDGTPKAATLLDQLGPEDQQKISWDVYETARFLNVVTRRKLLKELVQLNAEERRLFEVHARKIGGALGTNVTPERLVEFVQRVPNDRLTKLYFHIREAVAAHEQVITPSSEKAPSRESAVEAPPGPAAGVSTPPAVPGEKSSVTNLAERVLRDHTAIVNNDSLQPLTQLATGALGPEKGKLKSAITLAEAVAREPRSKPKVVAKSESVALPQKRVGGERSESRDSTQYKQRRLALLKAERVIGQGNVKEVEGKRTLALTFDDGPDLIFTPQILDILKKYNVKATFYVTGGSRINSKMIEMMKRIIKEGHQIGLHTWTHPHSMGKKMSAEQMWNQEVEPLVNLLKRECGYTATTMRAAEGSISKEQIHTLAQHGIIVVHWSNNADTFDYNNQEDGGEDTIFNNATKNKSGGVIVLAHSAGGKTRKETVKAVERLIPYLLNQQENTKLLRVDQIIGIAPLDSAVLQPQSPPVIQPDSKPNSGALENHGSPAPEGKELPKGAFAWVVGYPLGWRFENSSRWGEPVYKYAESEPLYDDLVKPFDGRTKDGRLISKDSPEAPVLRRNAYNAWVGLVAEFERTVPAETALRKFGLYITEGFRDFRRQKQMIQDYNRGGRQMAADVGASAHHTGRVVDICGANRLEIHNWLYELIEIEYRNRKIKIPRIVARGFVPTVSGEPWHHYFVEGDDGLPDVEKAVSFWLRYQGEIIKEHSKRMRPDFSEMLKTAGVESR